jgi:hypothetical protein
MTPTQKALACVLIVAGGIGLLTAYSAGKSRAGIIWQGVAQALEAQAKESDAKAEEFKRIAANHLAVADATAVRLRAVEKERDAARKQIPTPRPVPATSPDLAEGLVSAGFRLGAKVYDDNEPSKMNRWDAEKTWTWQQQSEMVPYLRSSLEITEKAYALRSSESESLRYSLTAKQGEIDERTAAERAQKDRAEALTKSIAEMNKQIKANEVKKWLQVAGAIGLGYLAGRAIK